MLDKNKYPYVLLGKSIKDARIKTGWSQSKASYLIDVGVNTLAGAERGYIWISKATYRKICMALGIDYNSIMLKERKRMEYENNSL